MSDLGSSAAAWVAIVVAVLSIIKQLRDAFKNRAKTRDQIQEALDKSPLVKEQLSIGNVGGAVEALNSIISSQTDYIRQQEARHRLREDELTVAVERHARRIKHLEERNEALEAEVEGWERRYIEIQRKLATLEGKR